RPHRPHRLTPNAKSRPSGGGLFRLHGLRVQNPNSPFLRQGSLSAESTLYPVGSRAAASSAWPSGSSARMTHSPFLWEEVTFFTRKARRTVSLTWASHMLQAMPSICAVVLYIVPSCSARV